MEEKAIIISVIVSLLIYSIGSSGFFIFAIKKAAKNFEEEKEKRRSFEAMAMLFRYLLTGDGEIYSHFERIETKKFIAYRIREILGNRFLKAFEKLEVHNDLADVYKQGPNWQPLKYYIIDKMRLELAKELYLHYTTLEINNAFKITAHAPEDRIRIAKEISLAIIMNAASKEKGEPALQETAEKIIKEFDLGDDRKTLLMAQVIKIEKGMPV